MTKKAGDKLKKYRQQLLDSEAPQVKAARKIYDEWFTKYVPLYLLNDTPVNPPKNWDDRHIWTQIEGFEEQCLVNGFVAYDKDAYDTAAAYFLTEHPFTSERLTQRVAITVDTECSECDGEGDSGDGEDCYLCYGSGSLTTDLTDDSLFQRLPAGAEPKYIGSVADLPDPPESSLKPVQAKKAKFCSECGNKLVVEAKFCSDCGKATAK